MANTFKSRIAAKGQHFKRAVSAAIFRWGCTRCTDCG